MTTYSQITAMGSQGVHVQVRTGGKYADFFFFSFPSSLCIQSGELHDATNTNRQTDKQTRILIITCAHSHIYWCYKTKRKEKMTGLGRSLPASCKLCLTHTHARPMSSAGLSDYYSSPNTSSPTYFSGAQFAHRTFDSLPSPSTWAAHLPTR